MWTDRVDKNYEKALPKILLMSFRKKADFRKSLSISIGSPPRRKEKRVCEKEELFAGKGFLLLRKH